MSTADEPHDLRVILADEHRLVRHALARLLASFPGVIVVAQAGDGEELRAALDAHAADVVVVDAAMGGSSGPDGVAALVRARPDLRVLLLETSAAAAGAERAAASGAAGLVTTGVEPAAFERALRRAAEGTDFVHEPGGGDRTAVERAAAGDDAEPVLTRRQLQVLRLVVEGLRTRDIARRLGVSVKTVETHRSDLMQRLGVGNMAGLVREALRRRLLPPA